MAGTWRRTLMLVHDGANGGVIYDNAGFVFSGTNGKRFIKRRDRRAKRRELKRIERESLIDHAYDHMMLLKEQREEDHELWLAEMELPKRS